MAPFGLPSPDEMRTASEEAARRSERMIELLEQILAELRKRGGVP
jgi:hypothetical protein